METGTAVLLHLINAILHLILKAYLCNASDRDRDAMTGVDFVTLHVQSQGVERDSGKKGT